MRGRKATINTIVSLLEQFITIICGLILPRLILSHFGSQYNGLTQSISQFLSCAVLLRSGIGGATRAALYKPLSEENWKEFNSVIKATDMFMKRIGAILAGCILLFATIYPVLVKNEFNWFFSFTLFLIIGASTFAESFFGITYLIVLQADQKVWVYSSLRILSVILNTVICSLLIINGQSIHVVKGGSALVYVLFPILLGAVVKRMYKIDLNVAPNTAAISQRWDAFWQQVAVFVMNNTDVMVLTVFTNMLEVSVYSVYNMVFSGIRTLLFNLTVGLEAAFGSMIAKKEDDLLKTNLRVVEMIIYGISTIICVCTYELIIDFVNIYTKEVVDVQYIRPVFAILIILSLFFNGVRMPYQIIVQAAGHYKQTKNGAIIEPIINLSVSIICVFKFGLVGVAVGTLIATIIRTVQYSDYVSVHIIRRSRLSVLFRCFVSFLEAFIAIAILSVIPIANPQDYLGWLLKAVICFGISFIVVVFLNLLLFRNDSKNTLIKIRALKKR
ncbi:oligosaccharide flippase family protein [Ruminococcus flavefaciens]|uniref:oligosaccharide flippase family protein n=1 Tax=Ruminococcus flavefaciens TaxID=1265 RepID=UPI0026EF3502|nr:oligosaccharide flippase family protein [Ruminococcus flavefaciens]